jgi:hypothetical protein
MGIDVLLQEIKGAALLGTGSFLHKNGEALHFTADFVAVEDSDPRGKNRGFKDGVLGAIKTKKGPLFPVRNYRAINRYSLGGLIK